MDSFSTLCLPLPLPLTFFFTFLFCSSVCRTYLLFSLSTSHPDDAHPLQSLFSVIPLLMLVLAVIPSYLPPPPCFTLLFLCPSACCFQHLLVSVFVSVSVLMLPLMLPLTRLSTRCPICPPDHTTPPHTYLLLNDRPIATPHATPRLIYMTISLPHSLSPSLLYNTLQPTYLPIHVKPPMGHPTSRLLTHTAFTYACTMHIHTHPCYLLMYISLGDCRLSIVCKLCMLSYPVTVRVTPLPTNPVCS